MRKVKQLWSAVRHGLTILWMLLRRFTGKPVGQVILIVAVCCVLASVVVVKFIREIPSYYIPSVPGTTLGASAAGVSASDSAGTVSTEAAQSDNESAAPEVASGTRNVLTSSHAYSRKTSSVAVSVAPHSITSSAPASSGQDKSTKSSSPSGLFSSEDNGISSSAAEKPFLSSSQRTDSISSSSSVKSELSSSQSGVSSVTEP